MELQTTLLKRLQTSQANAIVGSEAASGVVPLGRGARGMSGVVASVGNALTFQGNAGLEPAELERRLLEIGFVEGAHIEILHEGMIGGDPIAVRIDDARVALRRREADSVMVRVEAGQLRPRTARAA